MCLGGNRSCLLPNKFQCELKPSSTCAGNKEALREQHLCKTISSGMSLAGVRFIIAFSGPSNDHTVNERKETAILGHICGVDWEHFVCAIGPLDHSYRITPS